MQRGAREERGRLMCVARRSACSGRTRCATRARSLSRLVELDSRSTMDIDATARDVPVSVSEIERMVARIAAIPMDDGIEFRVKQATEIMEGADYPGVRVVAEAVFERSITPLKVDISTGDVVVPSALQINVRDKITHLRAANECNRARRATVALENIRCGAAIL